jgi:hypothetical protein
VRTTLIIDDELFERAITTVKEDRFRRKDPVATTQSGVVELALQALLRQFASQRLAAAYQPGADIKTGRRRRVR